MPAPLSIDLNCDLGEGGAEDSALMELVSSVNIACGGHAGDQGTMRRTMELAQWHGVAAGAHPGYADRPNFGRRELNLAPEAVRALVRDQVLALREFGPLKHVKPHGALYNRAARDAGTAEAVAAGVRDVDCELILVGLAGSLLPEAGRAAGMNVAEEAFADRTYGPDGRLLPRNDQGAVILDEQWAVDQALAIARDGRIPGGPAVRADTLCVHGDTPGALKMTRRLVRELQAAGIRIRALEPT
jgi:UPF0271 protein